jgi:hypothetical protein
LRVRTFASDFRGGDSVISEGSGVGKCTAEFSFGGYCFFACGVDAVLVYLFDEGIEVLEGVEFFVFTFVFGFVFILVMKFMLGLLGAIGSFHNVTILIDFIDETRLPARL